MSFAALDDQSNEAEHPYCAAPAPLGWQLQEAPVMLPPKRFSEALAAAARKGVLGQPEGALASGGPGE